MNVLAIDPANMDSGFVFIDNEDRIIYHEKCDNEQMFDWIKQHKSEIKLTVIEMPLIIGNSMHIRNTILFVGQLIQFLRHLNINYYTGMCRSTVTHAIIPKKVVVSDPELSNIKSNDVKIKVVMKRIYGHNLDIKTNDEYQALALYRAFRIKESENKLDYKQYYNNFKFPIPKRKKKVRKKDK